MKTRFIIVLACGALFIGWMLSAFSDSVRPVQLVLTTPSDTNVHKGDVQFVRVFDVDLASNTHYQHIDFGFAYTSFILEVFENKSIHRVQFTSSDGEVSALNLNGHTDHDGIRYLTNFVIPVQKQSTMDLFSGTLEGRVRIYLFNAPPIQPNLKSSLYKTKDSCNKPNMILGSVWRDGLPEPVGNREPNVVDHNVVHHAASSNTNHDYVNVVRNIYLLHTQSNGWDDIGYNFVVAQDGSIFEGRDPKTAGDMDNVKGAHFCGKNTGTMGICVLGNYMETKPSEAAVASLTRLITWKCYKSQINPLGSKPHPDAGSTSLKSICGHRDGCATACPGDSLYMELSKIRDEVNKQWLACGGTISSFSHAKLRPLPFTVYVASNQIQIQNAPEGWQNAEIISSTGQIIKSVSANTIITIEQPGTYVIRLYKQGVIVASKRFVAVQ